MLDQGSVGMRFKLFEELGLTLGGNPEWATSGLPNHVQHAKTMTFHVSVDGHQRDGKLAGRLLDRLTALHSGYNPFPQCQFIPSSTDNLHSLL